MTVTDERPGLGEFLERLLGINEQNNKRLDELRLDIRRQRGIFRPVIGSITALGASGALLTDLGGPAKGRMWDVREVFCFESGHEFTSPAANAVSSTGAAGAATSATLPFFTPFMTGFDVEIQPSAAAGLATITVTGTGPTLTYYLEESTTNTVSKSIRFPGEGQPYATVSVSAVASGGIVTVNVYGLLTGSPAIIGWYVGNQDAGATTTTRPVGSMLRWTQGQGTEAQDIFMPFFTFFGHREFPVQAPDHLLMFLTGGIANESFIFGAIVEEFEIPVLGAMNA